MPLLKEYATRRLRRGADCLVGNDGDQSSSFRNPREVVERSQAKFSADGTRFKLTLWVDSMHKARTGEVAEWLKAALC
jgi:hypothetical protein